MFLYDMLWLFANGAKDPLGRHRPKLPPEIDVLASSSANVPDDESIHLIIRDTGGTGNEGTHNASLEGEPGYERPTAQVVVKAEDFEAAYAACYLAYQLVVAAGKRSQFINNIWYRSMAPRQLPNDIGADANGKAQAAFNFDAVKRPDPQLPVEEPQPQ